MTRGRVVIACNLADVPQRIPLAEAAARRVVLASQPKVRTEPDALLLPAESVAVLAPDG